VISSSSLLFFIPRDWSTDVVVLYAAEFSNFELFTFKCAGMRPSTGGGRRGRRASDRNNNSLSAPVPAPGPAAAAGRGGE